jgi:hypothetical protein
MQNHHKDLLDRPMSRREFIQQVGVGLFLVFGGGAISQFLGGFDHSTKGKGDVDYGNRSYGG